METESKTELPFSLICVYNNRAVFDEYLVRSYREQSCSGDFVPVDNTQNRFTDAISAIEYGLSKAKHKAVIIAHQDIAFLDATALEHFAKRVIASQNELIGVIGIRYENHVYYGSVVQGKEKRAAYDVAVANQTESDVFALDECLFGFNSSLLQTIHFDKTTCDNWHFYAVDLCYQAALRGVRVLVFGTPVWHASTGSAQSAAFFRSLARMRRKYRTAFDRITSCCIECRMNRPLLQYRLRPLYHGIRHRIRVFLRVEQE